MNREFPGYFEKDHHRHPPPALESQILDLHGTTEKSKFMKDRAKKRALIQEIIHYPVRLSSQDVEAIVLDHHSVDECLAVDMNVAQQGEIPVVFVVTKPDADQFIDNKQEIHDELIQNIKKTLKGSNHQDLEKDLLQTIEPEEGCDFWHERVRFPPSNNITTSTSFSTYVSSSFLFLYAL